MAQIWQESEFLWAQDVRKENSEKMDDFYEGRTNTTEIFCDWSQLPIFARTPVVWLGWEYASENDNENNSMTSEIY